MIDGATIVKRWLAGPLPANPNWSEHIPGGKRADLAAEIDILIARLTAQLAEVTKERDAARQGEFRSAAAWKVVVAERDTLCAALRQCGEALRTWKMAGGQADVLHAALALPAVREAMEDHK